MLKTSSHVSSRFNGRLCVRITFQSENILPNGFRFREDFTSWSLFCRRPAAVEMLATTQEILLYHLFDASTHLGELATLKDLLSNLYQIVTLYI